MSYNFKLLLTAILISIFTFAISSCQKKVEPGKSIEQIRSEEGVPIRITTIGEREFNKNMTFFARVSGIRETMQQAAIGDKVAKIYARVGSQVREGQIIVEFPNDNPTLHYEQAKLGYESAKRLYERMKKLLEAGETAQQNFDNAETQYLVAKKNWESIYKLINIESPISGTIVQMFVQQGDKVKSDDNLFTVAQLDKMMAKVWVSAAEVVYIKPGMTANMRINGDVFEGRVAVVDLAMDDMKRAFGIEIHFDNRERKIKSGITTDITINAYNNSDAIMIPRKLIVRDGDDTFVYIEKDGKAYRRSVNTGLESGIDVEIKDGLAANDRLIVEGINLLRHGTKIKIVD